MTEQPASKPIRLVLKREHGEIVADVPERPGMVPVGRGETFYEAIGRWVHGNREYAGIELVVDPSASYDEMMRRARELEDR